MDPVGGTDAVSGGNGSPGVGNGDGPQVNNGDGPQVNNGGAPQATNGDKPQTNNGDAQVMEAAINGARFKLKTQEVPPKTENSVNYDHSKALVDKTKSFGTPQNWFSGTANMQVFAVGAKGVEQITDQGIKASYQDYARFFNTDGQLNVNGGKSGFDGTGGLGLKAFAVEHDAHADIGAKGVNMGASVEAILMGVEGKAGVSFVPSQYIDQACKLTGANNSSDPDIHNLCDAVSKNDYGITVNAKGGGFIGYAAGLGGKVGYEDGKLGAGVEVKLPNIFPLSFSWGLDVSGGWLGPKK